MSVVDQFYIDYFTSHLNIGLLRGSTVYDPLGLVEESGTQMRHVTLGRSDDVGNPELRFPPRGRVLIDGPVRWDSPGQHH